jgi:hypothetical protein
MKLYMKTVRKYLPLLLLPFGVYCSISNAQTFNLGLKMGMPGLNPLKGSLSSALSFPHSHFTVGPQFEVGLPIGLAIEVDALYTDVPYHEAALSTFTEKYSASNWEFPVLIKAHLGNRKGHRSFIGAGPSFRSIWGIRDTILGKKTAIGSTGITITSGSEFRLGPVSICPEVRYTHWGGVTFANGLELVLGNRTNQAQFLFGMVF